MSWGLMAGLGAGLSKVGDVAQQYYENKRRRVMEDSQLETAALTRALAQAAEARAAERNPLDLAALQGNIDLNSTRINSELGNQEDAAMKRAEDVMQLNQGTGPLSPELADQIRQKVGGGRLNPDGSVKISPVIQSEMDARKSQSQAAMINALADRTRAANDTTMMPFHQRLLDSQSDYYKGGGSGGFGRGRGGSSDPKVQMLLNLSKQYMTAHKNQMASSPLAGFPGAAGDKIRAQQEITNNKIANDAMEWARAQVERQYGPLTPEQHSEATAAVIQQGLEEGQTPDLGGVMQYGVNPGANLGMAPPQGAPKVNMGPVKPFGSQ